MLIKAAGDADFSPRLAANEAGAPKPLKVPFFGAAIAARDASEAITQLETLLEHPAKAPQMIAEGSSLVVGDADKMRYGPAVARECINRKPSEVRMSTEKLK